MKFKIQKIGIAFILVVGLLSACKKNTTTPEPTPSTNTSSSTIDCTGLTPTYTNDVKAILDNNCATSGCHNSSTKADGKDYSSYAAVKSRATSSSFMGSIQHKSGNKAMPMGGSKLPDDQIQKIYCWIQDGMPE